MNDEIRSILYKGANCLVEFEGGMGDHLMEAAAVLTAMEQYQNSTFSIRAEDSYVNILRRIPGIPGVQNSYAGQQKDQFNLTVSTHTQYYTNPRVDKGGKASIYGAQLGLDVVLKLVEIKLNPGDFEEESAFFSDFDLSGKKVNFMFQFHSRFKDARSWQMEKIPKLAELLKTFYDCNIFVLGSANEIPSGLANIIDLTGRCNWWQTCLLATKINLSICIDSGLLHVARSLGIPYITLWGATNPEIVLGEEKAEHDIRLQLDCYDSICLHCQLNTNACMEQITPEMVFKNIKYILSSKEVT